MKRTPYIINVSNIGERGGKILYNTLTGSIIQVSDEKYEKYMHNNYGSYLMLKNEFLLEDNVNYKEYLVEKLNTANDEYNVTIVLTLHCNLACSYCFESHIKRKNHISDFVLESIIKHIVLKISHSKYTKLNISFTGGEPFLVTEKIVSFLNDLSNNLVTNNLFDVELSTSIITNGTILDLDFLKKLQKYNLKSIQITFDGSKEFHNKSRQFLNGQGSYNLIMQNFNILVEEEFPVVIRINYNDSSILSIIDLLLDIRKVTTKMISVKMRYIMNNKSDYINDKVSRDRKINVKLKEIIEKTFLMNFDFSIGSICDACNIKSENNEYISTDGGIYRCYMMIDSKEHQVGDVFENVENETTRLFNSLSFDERCIVCPILSLCRGGCKYEGYIENGSINARKCFYREKLALLEQYLQSKYKV